MTREKIYSYRGDNGVLNTPIHLIGIDPSVTRFKLTADKNKILRSLITGEMRETVLVYEADVTNWEEIGVNNN